MPRTLRSIHSLCCITPMGQDELGGGGAAQQRPSRDSHTPSPHPPPPVREGSKPYSEAAQCLGDPVVGARQGHPLQSPENGFLFIPETTEREGSPGPSGPPRVLEATPSTRRHPAWAHAPGDGEDPLEQKRALKPCEGGRGVGAAPPLFGPQDPADPMVLRAVGGSLKERDALWS